MDIRSNIYDELLQLISPFEEVQPGNFFINNHAWVEFINKYKNCFIKSKNDFLIKRELYKKIDDLFLVVSALDAEGFEIVPKHRYLIFSLYIILELFRNAGYIIPLKETRKLLGYSEKSSSVDKLLIDGGILDKYGMTRTKSIGIRNTKVHSGICNDENKKPNMVKYKLLQKNWRKFNYGEGNFYPINIGVLLYMLFHIDYIECTGLYLYCFLLSHQRGDNPVFLREEYITATAKLSAKTVEKYLVKLEDLELLKITHGEYIRDDYGDFLGKEVNSYEPVKKLHSEMIFDKIKP